MTGRRGHHSTLCTFQAGGTDPPQTPKRGLVGAPTLTTSQGQGMGGAGGGLPGLDPGALLPRKLSVPFLEHPRPSNRARGHGGSPGAKSQLARSSDRPRVNWEAGDAP